MTQATIKLIELKDKHWKTYCKRKTVSNYRRYCLARNQSTAEVRRARFNYETSLANEIKTNPRLFYSYTRLQTSIKEKITSVKDENGELISEPSRVAEVLYKAFQSVFVDEPRPLPIFCLLNILSIPYIYLSWMLRESWHH